MSRNKIKTKTITVIGVIGKQIGICKALANGWKAFTVFIRCMMSFLVAKQRPLPQHWKHYDMLSIQCVPITERRLGFGKFLLFFFFLSLLVMSHVSLSNLKGILNFFYFFKISLLLFWLIFVLDHFCIDFIFQFHTLWFGFI